MEDNKYIEVNKSLWNGKTEIHIKSDFYDVDSFKKGKSSLNHVELEGLGDVKGKSLLHLQCHFGLDSLSWSRLGAKVTGIDLSDKAIDTAKQLNDELGLDAKFICSDLYSSPEVLSEKFDIVFTSYGTIGWLPDLNKWAEVISHFLKPGGIFFMADFHPFMWLFDKNYEKIIYPYFNLGAIVEENQGTYAKWEADFRHKSYEWNHSLSDLISSILKQKFTVESFKEYPYCFHDCFNKAEQGKNGFWHIKGYEGMIPMMYSIKAIK